MIAILALLASSTAAATTDVGVLVVGDSAQYVQAGRAAVESLGADARLTVVAADAALPDAWRATPPRVVIAVGARAVRLALAATDAAVIAVMVLQQSPELTNPRVRVVPAAVPMERQLELLKRLRPAAKRVGLVIDPTHSSLAAEEARAAATRTGHTIVVREVSASSQAAAAIEKALAEADALVLVADTTVVKRETLEVLVRIAGERGVPVIGYSAAVVQTGLLAGYAVDPEEHGALAARAAKVALTGGPVERASPDGRLHVNLKTARTLGLVVPAAMLASPTVIFDPR